jgi:hypothetical protein
MTRLAVHILVGMYKFETVAFTAVIPPFTTNGDVGVGG